MVFTHIADEGVWNRIVRQLPGHGIHQSWGWGELRSGQHVAVRRYALMCAGAPRAAASVELRRVARTPWRIAYAPRGPLWVSEADLAEFLPRLAADLRRSGAVQLRVHPSAPADQGQRLREFGFSPATRTGDNPYGTLPELTARLTLRSGRDGAAIAFELDAGRQAGQSERTFVQVLKESDDRALDALYPLLARNSEQRGDRLPDLQEFRKFVSAWLWRGEGALLLARRRGECVGGAVCTFFGDEAMGHFFADGQDLEDLSASYALHAAGVEEANVRGCRYFDFGRVASEGDDDSLHFDREFGAVPFHHGPEWSFALRSALHRGRRALRREGLLLST